MATEIVAADPFRPENSDGYVRAIADSERTWHIAVIDGLCPLWVAPASCR
jgi:hypothetical protein